MQFDRVIASGQVLQHDEFVPLDIAIRGGQIAALGPHGAFAGIDAEVTAAGGYLVFPAAIDSHFHSRAPSHPEREDFRSATAAAAAGGITSLVEMPISEPPTTTGDRLLDRAELACRDGYVDVGFYASSATLSRDDLLSSVTAGALAFKGFLQQVPLGRESEFEGLCLPTNGDLIKAFQLLSEFALPCVFHAEDESMVKTLEAELRRQGRSDGLAHAESRPDVVEAVSVGTLLRLGECFGVHVHVPHVSAGLTVTLIREAKARGVKVTAETCPQYLQFDASALAQFGPYAKCNPPFRSKSDVAAVWQGVMDGTIDTLASDHSPFTAAEKDAALNDIWLGPPGFPGVEVLMPFTVGAALDGSLAWRRLNELLFENPARIFGLWPRKGVIRPGADADIVLYDDRDRGTFDHRTMRCKNPETNRLWDGVPRSGSVAVTLLRGEPVFDGTNVMGRPGTGRHLRRVEASKTLNATG